MDREAPTSRGWGILRASASRGGLATSLSRALFEELAANPHSTDAAAARRTIATDAAAARCTSADTSLLRDIPTSSGLHQRRALERKPLERPAPQRKEHEPSLPSIARHRRLFGIFGRRSASDGAQVRSSSLHTWAVTVATDPGRSFIHRLGVVMVSNGLVALQLAVLVILSIESSHPTCAKHSMCMTGTFCDGTFPDWDLPRCTDCIMLQEVYPRVTSKGLGSEPEQRLTAGETLANRTDECERVFRREMPSLDVDSYVSKRANTLHYDNDPDLRYHVTKQDFPTVREQDLIFCMATRHCAMTDAKVSGCDYVDASIHALQVRGCDLLERLRTRGPDGSLTRYRTEVSSSSLCACRCSSRSSSLCKSKRRGHPSDHTLMSEIRCPCTRTWPNQ